NGEDEYRRQHGNGEREYGHYERAARLGRRDDGIPEPSRRGRGRDSGDGGEPLHGARYTAPDYNREPPLKERAHVGHGRGHDDSPRNRSGRDGHGVEEVIYPRDIICGDLEYGGDGEGRKRRVSAYPAELRRKRNLPRQRRDAHNEQRYEYPESARRRQPDADEDGQKSFHSAFSIK